VSLAPGSRVGPYEVVAAIGAGGMGEVYRARDTKLGRDVALKILPDAFAHDAERLARFEREARTLAALNHPNIAAIYGVEANALVMELVAGEDLSRRVARGPIPIADALPIARQIADALEAAHDAGIIHRDLKPANVKVREDGTVKVLDFGLARTTNDEADYASHDRSTSPTILSPAVTTMGVILGTAAYMSPEQAKGRPADRRADVWSFGVVLFEMLTGRRLFDGPDVTETLAAVLTSAPNWDSLPADASTNVKRLLSRCLAKDRRMRLDSFTAVRLDLDEAILGSSAPVAPASPSRDAWVAALVLLALVAGALASHWLWHAGGSGADSAGSSPIVTTIDAAPDAVSAFTYGFALSPDATTLVYVARTSDGLRRLWLRRLSDPHAKDLPATEGASYPFWSPDGRDIGFFADAHLKRVPLAGGPAQTIAEAPGPWTRGSWGSRGILFSLSSDDSLGIRLVNPTGGQTIKLPIAGVVFEPQWLPDGRHFLFVRSDKDRSRILAASIEGGDPVVVQDLDQTESVSGVDPGYRYSLDGYFVFNNAGALSMRRFDAATLKAVGTITAIGDPVGTPRSWFAASVAGSTVVALNPPAGATGGTPGDPITRLEWVDRTGRVVGQLGQPGRYWTMHLSPDGQHAIANPGEYLWAIDARTNVKTRVAIAAGGVWMPDNRTIIYRDQTGLKMKVATSDEPPRSVLMFGARTLLPTSVSSDGKRLLATARPSVDMKSLDILQINIADGSTTPLVATDAAESEGAYAPPDGVWIAYMSDASGRPQVYLRRLSGDTTPIQVSVDGGDHPMWRADGRELFFLSPTDEVVAVDVSALAKTGQPGERRVLFRALANDIIRESFPPYAVTPDGQRFLINAPASPEPLTLMQKIGG
jgi:serine/threonine protein kinase/Tol biopolymer transport system component